MRDFIAIHILVLMGIVSMPSYLDYNSSRFRYAPIADVMSLKLYQQIGRFLHFADNSLEDTDRYYKVRPIAEKIRKNCLLQENENKFSIDEMTIAYKGRKAGNRKQYMKDKPNKWGFKNYVRGGSFMGYIKCNPGDKIKKLFNTDKPLCKTTVTAIVGAAINEAVRISCEVDAFPLPKNFQWTLNNTLGTTELDAGKFTIEKSGRSILKYVPISDMDYGSLACRATNLAGQQIEPCRYTLLPAVKPDPPANCYTLNLTDDSAEVKCVAGYDGGLQTTYFVEAWESDELIANMSAILPFWKLQGLSSGKALQLVFYAKNARGRSKITTLRIHTSRLALHTEENYMIIDPKWALGIVVGALGTLAAVAVIIILPRRLQRPLGCDVPLQTMKVCKDAIHSSNHSPVQDDKNPDVVPLGKDFNYTRDSELPPEPPPYGIALSNIQPVGASKSIHSLHDRANTPHTLNTPGSDGQSISTLTEDRRSLTSGTLSRRREVVTTRTTLLTNARESCV
ncbi:unnamed protein product [Danaus chrysippus]|uniref:(African queen) hypothetical protein n=1 Tax=Danaus chrysippus TaxID=151541 RepID=A0A8J2W185_9NEOP|nr:unnamed protein product [Danaus chrysippus]